MIDCGIELAEGISVVHTKMRLIGVRRLAHSKFGADRRMAVYNLRRYELRRTGKIPSLQNAIIEVLCLPFY